MLQHLNALLHVFHGNELKSAMEVFAAGTQVGAQQSLIGQSCAVRTAPNGHLSGLYGRRKTVL